MLFFGHIRSASVKKWLARKIRHGGVYEPQKGEYSLARRERFGRSQIASAAWAYPARCDG